MAKDKITYVCNECGAQSIKWQGQCPKCFQWNTLEEFSSKELKNKNQKIKDKNEIFASISNISVNKEIERLKTSFSDIDGLLGGGILAGSLILIGGEPGIGKSTLLLQILTNISTNYKINTLYISAEEAPKQIKERAERLGNVNKEIFLYNSNKIENIIAAIEEKRPEVVVVDSIQMLFSQETGMLSGTPAQIRFCTEQLLNTAKKLGISIIIIGHITKQGNLAGPKLLEHIVDTVLYFEGERSNIFRVIRSVKNRFGATDEIAVLQMTGKGLIEVENPSALFLSENQANIEGTSVTSFLEGSKAMLIEVQSLISTSHLPMPRRVCLGIDINKLHLIIAILEKRCKLFMQNQDIYLSLTGGMKIKSPSIDLGIAAALISGLKNIQLDPKTVFCGELGLGGELRPVANIEKIIIQAKKLGFTKICIPFQKFEKKKIKGIEVRCFRFVYDLLDFIS